MKAVALNVSALAVACACACGARSPLDEVTSAMSTGDAGVLASPVDSVDSGSREPRSVRVSSLALGANESCAVMSDGTVRCWGYAGFHVLGPIPTAQCGDGVSVAVTPCVRVPTVFPELTGVVQLAIGDTHGCALFADGTVRCWGTGRSVGATDGDVVVDPAAAPVPRSPRVVALGASAGTCARREDSSVWCWGHEDYGELGHGTRDGFRGATQLAMGHHFTCARMVAGTVACAGSNDEGQLGNGIRTGEEAHPVPTPVIGLSSVVQIDSGDDHSCAVSSDGTVSCWGSSRAVVSWHLARVDVLTDAVQVAAGDGYTCALHRDGTVACWGVNLEGQLGDGTHAFRERPTPVVGLHGVVQIAARNNHTCALTESGDVYCWGLNAHGEVGDGTTTDRSEPTRIDL